jgi:pimeloyl-ACP methyl ester carboxylesterase
MVLISPYTSMTLMMKRFVPIVPASLLIRDRFDNLAKAPEVKHDTLVVHGDQDALIPVAMGHAVAAALPNGRIEVFEGGSHNDLFQREGGRLLTLIVAVARETRASGRAAEQPATVNQR